MVGVATVAAVAVLAASMVVEELMVVMVECVEMEVRAMEAEGRVLGLERGCGGLKAALHQAEGEAERLKEILGVQLQKSLGADSEW